MVLTYTGIVEDLIQTNIQWLNCTILEWNISFLLNVWNWNENITEMKWNEKNNACEPVTSIIIS